jgi:hypothetical protein
MIQNIRLPIVCMTGTVCGIVLIRTNPTPCNCGEPRSFEWLRTPIRWFVRG